MTSQLDDAFMCAAVPPEIMDALWATGWRHFGRYFFRYSHQPAPEGGLQTVTPLRIDLQAFTRSKSQRRVVNKNADLQVAITPARLDDELHALFARHKQRFSTNVPESLETFMGQTPEAGPCECRMLQVRDSQGRLLAASFLDMGQEAASSVYGMFEPEPEVAWRSLGILTLLLELSHCQEAGLRWLYPGYATRERSSFDYKKQFRSTQWLDWRDAEWKPLEATPAHAEGL